MTKQEEFEEAIKNNKSAKIRLLLADPNVDPSFPIGNGYAILDASENGYFEIVKLLLNDKRINPAIGYNYAISGSSKNGHIEIVKLLLNDKRVDPSQGHSYTIRQAHANGHKNVVELLWKDNRVKNILKNDYIELYDEFIKKDNLIKNIKEF